MSTTREKRVFAVGAACLFFIANSTVFAEDSADAGLFGNSFVGSGELPNSTIDSGIQINEYSDLRGDVSEWSFSKGRREIKREVWSEENGGSQGLMSFGIRF